MLSKFIAVIIYIFFMITPFIVIILGNIYVNDPNPSNLRAFIIWCVIQIMLLIEKTRIEIIKAIKDKK